MRSLAVLAGLIARVLPPLRLRRSGWLVLHAGLLLGTGCTIHVVEQPGVPVAPVQPTPAWQEPRARPTPVVRHEPVPLPPTQAAKPREPRPTEVASKPKPHKPKPHKPKPHEPEPVAEPIRTVRDAGSRVVGRPSGHVREHDDQHARAHRMQR